MRARTGTKRAGCPFDSASKRGGTGVNVPQSPIIQHLLQSFSFSRASSPRRNLHTILGFFGASSLVLRHWQGARILASRRIKIGLHSHPQLLAADCASTGRLYRNCRPHLPYSKPRARDLASSRRSLPGPVLAWDLTGAGRGSGAATRRA